MSNRPREYIDDQGQHYYKTAGGQAFYYDWCPDCGGSGCDYCDDEGSVRVDGLPPKLPASTV